MQAMTFMMKFNLKRKLKQVMNNGFRSDVRS